MPRSVPLLITGTTPAFNIAHGKTHSEKRAGGKTSVEAGMPASSLEVCKTRAETTLVMPALVAAIHDFTSGKGKC